MVGRSALSSCSGGERVGITGRVIVGGGDIGVVARDSCWFLEWLSGVQLLCCSVGCGCGESRAYVGRLLGDVDIGVVSWVASRRGGIRGG